jgi:hypothetical protein
MSELQDQEFNRNDLTDLRWGWLYRRGGIWTAPCGHCGKEIWWDVGFRITSRREVGEPWGYDLRNLGNGYVRGICPHCQGETGIRRPSLGS